MKYGLLLLILLVGCDNQNNTDMNWLEGTWRHTNLDYPAFERWEIGDSGSMTGSGFIVDANGDTTVVERFSIIERNGQICYRAQVGENETLLPLVTKSDSVMIFENQNNDFPRKLSYTKTSDNSINANIYGIIEGEEKVFEFIMKKE